MREKLVWGWGQLIIGGILPLAATVAIVFTPNPAYDDRALWDVCIVGLATFNMWAGIRTIARKPDPEPEADEKVDE